MNNLLLPYYSVAFLIGGIVFVTIALFGLYNLINPIPIFKDVQYEVSINNNVKMSDFYNHYNVISQDGKIYTVNIKNN